MTYSSSIALLFHKWLGTSAFSDANERELVAVFHATLGTRAEIPPHELEAAMSIFVAIADRYASRVLLGTEPPRLAPVFERGRHLVSGLRYGHMGHPRATRAQDTGEKSLFSEYVESELLLASASSAPKSFTFKDFAAACQRLAPSLSRTAIVMRELVRIAASIESQDQPTRHDPIDTSSLLCPAGVGEAPCTESAFSARLAFVTGTAYSDLLRRLTRRSRTSIDIRVPRIYAGTSKAIDTLLEELHSAVSRGVSVRILSAHVRCTADRGRVAALASNLRTYPRSQTGHLLHESTAVFDSARLVTGTQSWTPNAIHRSIELSTFVESAALAESINSRMDQLWSVALPPKAVRSSDTHGSESDV